MPNFYSHPMYFTVNESVEAFGGPYVAKHTQDKNHNIAKNVKNFTKVKDIEDNFWMKKAAEEIEAAMALYNDRKGVEAYKRAKAVHTDLVNDTMRRISDGEKKVKSLLNKPAKTHGRWKKIACGVFITAATAGTIVVLSAYLWG